MSYVEGERTNQSASGTIANGDFNINFGGTSGNTGAGGLSAYELRELKSVVVTGMFIVAGVFAVKAFRKRGK